MRVNHKNNAEYVSQVNIFVNSNNKTQIAAMALGLTTYIPPWILHEQPPEYSLTLYLYAIIVSFQNIVIAKMLKMSLHL